MSILRNRGVCSNRCLYFRQLQPSMSLKANSMTILQRLALPLSVEQTPLPSRDVQVSLVRTLGRLMTANGLYSTSYPTACSSVCGYSSEVWFLGSCYRTLSSQLTQTALLSTAISTIPNLIRLIWIITLSQVSRHHIETRMAIWLMLPT